MSKYTYKSGYDAWCKHEDNKFLTPFSKKSIGVGGSRGSSCTNDCDLIVDCGRLVPPQKGLFASNKRYRILEKYIETPDIIKIAWTDYSIPPVLPGFWVDLYNLIPNNSKVIFTCTGGHGRTGTGLVCFLMGSGEYNPVQALKYVRATYCSSAVENSGQEGYIWNVGEWVLQQEGHEQKYIDRLYGKFQRQIAQTITEKKKSAPQSSLPGFDLGLDRKARDEYRQMFDKDDVITSYHEY